MFVALLVVPFNLWIRLDADDDNSTPEVKGGGTWKEFVILSILVGYSSDFSLLGVPWPGKKDCTPKRGDLFGVC